jgi:hypothetical protein
MGHPPSQLGEKVHNRETLTFQAFGGVSSQKAAHAAPIGIATGKYVDAIPRTPWNHAFMLSILKVHAYWHGRAASFCSVSGMVMASPRAAS